MTRLRSLALAMLSLALLPAAADAHASLLRASPAEASTVPPAPKTLDLSFSEGLVGKLSGVELHMGDKAIALGAAALSNDGEEMTVPLPMALVSGTYRVDWHALSNDGHETEGAYDFTVAP